MNPRNLLRKSFLTLLVVFLASLFLLSVHAQPSMSRVTLLSPQEPGTLLPHFDLLTLTHEVQHLIFDCLFVVDADGNYVPQLATEVPTVDNGGISDDATAYTIRVREGVQWHDGEPLTAEDVVFTWQVITNPDLPVPSRAVWEDIERIETPDSYTAEVHFAEPNVNFLAAAATNSCFILPQHLLEGEDIANSPLHRQPVGTGPFTFTQWAAGSFLELDANPNYWQASPQLDEIIVRIVPGSEGQRAALQRNEAELFLHMTSADVNFVNSLPTYEVVTAPTHAWWLFWINNSDPILQDVAVRQALAYGLDKETITASVMRGIAEPLDAALPPSHWAHNPDVTSYPYDPEEAQRLLEEAGWAVGADGIRSRNGERLRLEILSIAGQVERRQVIQIVQDYWSQLGIDVQIREIDGASFPPTMTQGDYQLAYGWFSETQEPVFNLWLGTNWQRYTNEEALSLLREAPTVVDREVRAELIRRFQELVAQDVAILPLAPRPILNAVSNRLEGFQPILSGSLWNAHEWTLQ